ncbi:unnamed protein product [Moneuplotes crassus]|uniref:Uncharacterized protein n=1 Tax=Euplotes crassus TaxID=5936 RepID=A0AAD1XZY9_EUPCR|nr:unnamed protein product [Moneuplotes crassus]
MELHLLFWLQLIKNFKFASESCSRHQKIKLILLLIASTSFEILTLLSGSFNLFHILYFQIL